jgi:hypothetical protein
MVDEVERMARALDAIKSALLKRKLSEADLADARAALEALRSIVARSGEKTHSIREIEGLGAEYWQGSDVDAFIKRERESWR